MKGFLENGPNGPRMSEQQLALVTRAVQAAYGAMADAGPLRDAARATCELLDAYPVDRSCWTCTHSVTRFRNDPGAEDEGLVICRKLEKAIPPEFTEGTHPTRGPCPHYEEPTQ